MTTLFMRVQNTGLFDFMAYDICSALRKNFPEVAVFPRTGIEAKHGDSFVRITYDASDMCEMHTIEVDGTRAPAVTAELKELYREYDFEQVRPS